MRLILALALLFALPAAAQDYPDYREIYVNDFANLLPEEDERAVRTVLTELREETGIEFTVVTLGAFSDMNWTGAIEPYATALFNDWGVGDASRNDGVMMLVVRDDRVMRLELGAGWSAAYDSEMQDVIDGWILPLFRQSRYADGIRAGVDEAIYRLTDRRPGDYHLTASQQFFQDAQEVAADPQPWWAAPIAVLSGLGLWFWRRWRRRRPRICPNDGARMVRLDDFAEDLHLTEGQNLEEQLKSVDYDVWRCETCGHVTVETYRSWFSGYGACPQCSFRTVEGEETITRRATRTRSGFKRIDYTCHNCGHTYSETRTIPKISDSSSSSSSSSSFGGGSSSGGGASGSW